MKTLKGPAIFLAQFMDDEAPFNSIEAMARWAADLGFVNEVVPADKLMDTTKHWANSILKNAPLSVRATKQCAMNVLDHASLDEAMKASYTELDVMLTSDDAKEGPEAFSEKRSPNWTGH